MTYLRGRRPASALVVNIAVIRAIILRDISVLVGPNGIGLVVLLLMPLGHLMAITIIYKVLGRVAPVGSDEIVYYGISVLPFVIFIYSSRQVMMSIVTNRALLYFHRVKVFDILYARAILEMAISVVVFIVVILALLFASHDFSPKDPASFVAAVAATIYLTCSMGMLNALIGQIWTMWYMIVNISGSLLWMASGIIFFPSAIPEPYSRWMSWNPLMHCVEWTRYAYYENYPDKSLDITYIFNFSTACIALSLIGERLARVALR